MGQAYQVVVLEIDVEVTGFRFSDMPRKMTSANIGSGTYGRINYLDTQR
jgi:hypothetical protein